MKKFLAIIALVACFGMMTGCAGVVWNASFYETAMAGDAAKMVESTGAKEVGKYTSFLGYAFGYETYAGLVSAELRKGKKNYHVVTKNYFLWSTTHGYVEDL